jgi:hypothetical protein
MNCLEENTAERAKSANSAARNLLVEEKHENGAEHNRDANEAAVIVEQMKAFLNQRCFLRFHSRPPLDFGLIFVPLRSDYSPVLPLLKRFLKIFFRLGLGCPILYVLRSFRNLQPCR